VGRRARIAAEGPAAIALDRLHHRQRDHVRELLETTEDDGAMRPRAGERDVEMIAVALRRKAAVAGGTRPAVGVHPVAVQGLRPPEASALDTLAVVAVVVPRAVDQEAHAICPV